MQIWKDTPLTIGTAVRTPNCLWLRRNYVFKAAEYARYKKKHHMPWHVDTPAQVSNNVWKQRRQSCNQAATLVSAEWQQHLS